MLQINISFKHQGTDFAFKAEIPPNKVHIFDVGERMLADKLFYVLTGLDSDYRGTMTGADWSHSRTNNVLALGDSSMFIKGGARKNICKAFRVRMKRKEAKQKTKEVMRLYNIQNDAVTDDADLLKIALARARFREITLAVANCFETFIEPNSLKETLIKNFTTKPVPYIIEIH